jgi:mono/diheme cytochrome c family protein
MRTAEMRHFKWLPIALAVAMTSLIACTAEVPGQGVDEDDPRAALRGLFNRDILPLMQGTCAACHGGSMQFIDWMAPDDDFPTEYDKVLNWPALVNIQEPGQSRLITKGQHDGRPWTADELNIINPWLAMEAAFGGTGEEIDTTDVTPLQGFNSFDLGTIGLTEAAGCFVEFDFERSDPVAYLSNIVVRDTSGDGCLLESPVIGVVLDSGTFYDPNNKFSDVTVDVGPNETAPVGGTLLIISWLDPADLAASATFRLKFRFFGVESMGSGDNNGGAGAQLVDFFYNNVVTNCINGLNAALNCVGCHGDGAAQQGAIDLGGLQAVDETERQQQANEIFLRSDRTEPGVPGGDPWIAKVDPAEGVAHNGGNVADAVLIQTCYDVTADWIMMEISQ